MQHDQDKKCLDDSLIRTSDSLEKMDMRFVHDESRLMAAYP